MKTSLFTIASCLVSAALASQSHTDSISAETRVVGGTEVGRGQNLYTTGVRYFRDGINHCGGSLIAPKVVLTAAHCLQPVEVNGTKLGKKDLYVSVGSNLNQGTYDGQQIKVKHAIVHPRYNNETRRYDYAILILRKPALAKYKPVRLGAADGSDTKVGTKATIRGWGTTKEDGGPESVSGFKLEVTLPIISNRKCHNVYKSVVGIAPDMMCAGGFAKKDACQGDSGGPMVVKQSDGSERLVGVVSFGAGCARPGIPGVYGRISHAMPFIERVMRRHSLQPISSDKPEKPEESTDDHYDTTETTPDENSEHDDDDTAEVVEEESPYIDVEEENSPSDTPVMVTTTEEDGPAKGGCAKWQH